MFETLFGSEIPLAARFFIAFLVVLALIGLTAWLVRRFGSNRLGGAPRGRQPRLAVIDAASVARKRELAEEKSVLDFALWGGLVPGNLDQRLRLAEPAALASGKQQPGDSRVSRLGWLHGSSVRRRT